MTRNERTRSGRRGFTLITTTTLIALVTVTSLLVINIIEIDFAQIAQQRRTMASREAAEGGLMELLNNQDVLVDLPTLETQDLSNAYAPTSDSVFGQQSDIRGEREFDAEIELVRQVPMLESSHEVVRALVYDVRVRARTGDGGTSRIEAEVFRITASKPGTIRPRMHAR